MDQETCQGKYADMSALSLEHNQSEISQERCD